MAEQENISARSNHAMNIISAALQELWDKAQTVVGLLKEEKEKTRVLLSEKDALEKSLTDMQEQLDKNNLEIEELQNKSMLPPGVDVGDRLLYLSADEREALERRIDDLLGRINAHLGSAPK